MRIIHTLAAKQSDLLPFWFMRQAGRYLPEYRKIRENFSDFLSFCYHPQAATEVTLQPITRFGCDAAIIFSDILVIPDALGQKVGFTPGHGPQLNPLRDGQAIAALLAEGITQRLAPVYQAIRDTRALLAKDKALIGFAGAPWTLACYMIEGKGSKEFAVARHFAYTNSQAFDRLIAVLEEAVIAHLSAQIEAGADAVQLFDSWAGVLPPELLDRVVTAPTRRIVAALHARFPTIPIIAFARGVGVKLADYASQVRPDALGVDTMTPLAWVNTIREGAAIQGNLDPQLLVADSDGIVAAVRQAAQTMRGVPYVVNLGHGIVPETPIAHVQALCDAIRNIRGE